jgi:hypothetical protein
MFPECSICKMKLTDTQSRYQYGMSISEDIIVLNTNIVLSKLTQSSHSLIKQIEDTEVRPVTAL